MDRGSSLLEINSSYLSLARKRPFIFPSSLQSDAIAYLFLSFLPTKLNRRINANAREVETLLKGIIKKKERAMKNGQGDDGDVLGLLLQSNAKEGQESGRSKPMMTMDDIIGELKLFYFAGMETTSVLLTWTMILLSMNPEWQDRAREEVLRVFGNKQPDLDGVNQLKIVSLNLS
jgi:cytochrome P450